MKVGNLARHAKGEDRKKQRCEGDERNVKTGQLPSSARDKTIVAQMQESSPHQMTPRRLPWEDPVPGIC